MFKYIAVAFMSLFLMAFKPGDQLFTGSVCKEPTYHIRMAQAEAAGKSEEEISNIALEGAMKGECIITGSSVRVELVEVVWEDSVNQIWLVKLGNGFEGYTWSEKEGKDA